MGQLHTRCSYADDIQMSDSKKSEAGKQYPHQRSMKNLLLRPDFQLKYSFYFVGITLVVMGAVFMLFLLSLKDMIKTLAAVYTIETSVVEAINESIGTATYTTIVVALLFGLISISLGVILTHRLIGPMIPIRRLIEQLADGAYGTQGRLRSKDDYQEIMNDLNRLSKVLADKHGSSQTGS